MLVPGLRGGLQKQGGVNRLDERGLAQFVRPVQHSDARPEPNRRRTDATEVTDFKAFKPHDCASLMSR